MAECARYMEGFVLVAACWRKVRTSGGRGIWMRCQIGLWGEDIRKS